MALVYHIYVYMRMYQVLGILIRLMVYRLDTWIYMVNEVPNWLLFIGTLSVITMVCCFPFVFRVMLCISALVLCKNT